MKDSSTQRDNARLASARTSGKPIEAMLARRDVTRYDVLTFTARVAKGSQATEDVHR